MNRTAFRRIRLLFSALFLVGCSNGVQRDVPTVRDINALAAETQTATFQVKASADDAEGSTGVAAIQYLIAPSSNSA